MKDLKYLLPEKDKPSTDFVFKKPTTEKMKERFFGESFSHRFFRQTQKSMKGGKY